MTLIKSILLGSAAGIVAVAGAQAADLPTKKAAPAADYVKICNINGTAGFIVPGSDTCLKLYGGVVWEGIFASAQDAYLPDYAKTVTTVGGVTTTTPRLNPVTGLPIPTQVQTGTQLRDTFDMGGRGVIGFDATSNTAWGPLFAEAEFRGNYSTSTQGTFPGTFGNGFSLDHAKATWAGLTFGYVTTFYNLGNGPGDLDYFSPDPGTVPLIAYTASFGGGFSATLSLEDGVKKRTNGIYNALQNANQGTGQPSQVFTGLNNVYHGTQYPDVVVQLGIAQGWGSAKIAGAAHNSDILYGPFGAVGYGGDNFWGYGVNTAVSINLPSLGPKSEFTIQGAYSHGALSLGGATGPGVIPFNGSGPLFELSDAVQRLDGTFSEPNSWSIASHLKYQINPQFSIAPELSYAEITYGGDLQLISNKWQGFLGGLITNWDPTPGLDFQLDLVYVDSKQSVPSAWIPTVETPSWNTHSNGFFGRLAIARTF